MADMMNKPGKLVFDLPNDEELAALKEGETLEVSAIVRREPGEKVCVIEVNGNPVGDYDEKERTEEDEEADEDRDILDMMEEEPSQGDY